VAGAATSSAVSPAAEATVARAPAPGGKLARLRHLPGPDATLVFVVVLLVALFCRILYLPSPDKSLIFDEVYYVNAARVILHWPVPADAPYAGQPAGHDPNQEHPPLGKLLIAGSMALFGDRPLGWRLPSILAGMASLVLLYGVVRELGGDAWLAVLASTLFAFDNLVLVHSRIATLDMMLVAFLLLSAWLAARGRPLLAGAASALAALVKLGGLYGLLAILLFEAVPAARAWYRTRTWSWSPVRSMVIMGLSFAVVWVAGLWLLDLHFSAFRTPWAHLRFMLQYGFSLARPGGPANSESQPWQWLINEVQMPYLRVDQQLEAGGHVITTRPLIYFRGAMNPILIGAAPLGICFAAWQYWKSGSRVALWAIVWFAATYLPFYPPAMISHRISYIFYFLPTIPAVAVGLALLLREAGLPRIVLWGFLIMVLVGFIGYFPFQYLF
jgi:dolichyl-phosphate-mannose-protein mannosyltransferase